MNKSTLSSDGSQKNVTTLIGTKTVSTATAYKHGSVTCIELYFSDASTNYVKVGPNGQLEIGGTNEMGTGTKVIW